jgi:hypothetical protein
LHIPCPIQHRLISSAHFPEDFCEAEANKYGAELQEKGIAGEFLVACYEPV